MRATLIREPRLEFGSGSDTDVRRGLAHLGPLDVSSNSAPSTIRLGMIGLRESVEAASAWLTRCRSPVAAKETRLRTLFPEFPGFSSDTAFRSEIALSPLFTHCISKSTLAKVLKGSPDEDVRACSEVFLRAIDTLLDTSTPDVIAVCVPPELVEIRDKQSETYLRSGRRDRPCDFHDLLKARALERFRIPLQLLLPSLYGGQMPERAARRTRRRRTVQDEATRAWNLHAALYYKAGGRPWRLARNSSDLATCFVGINFPFALSGETRFSSLAQVFDERGDGIIVRGAGVRAEKGDRTPRLDQDAAYSLLSQALERYYDTHRQYPARVVIHKASAHDDAEISGFRTALTECRIEHADFVSFGLRSSARLFRLGKYPPLRGSLLELDDRRFVLYTRGSVPYFRTYPGQYVPRPLAYQIDAAESTPQQVAADLLGLSKMNWNDTQFDHRLPITIEAAKSVGKILRYVNRESLASRYSFFM